MFMGHADGLSEIHSSREKLLAYPDSDLGDEESVEHSVQILYTASFEELAKNIVQYDTIIWLSISLMLVLAWGVGVLMLLYLPFKRYVLQKDVYSRQLHVTPSEIVYKVLRPSYIPFWGTVKFEQRVQLSRVIDIIIEQGCLQSKYEIHTFRVESISRGGATPVDELRVQGISNPELLRKVIVREASKIILDGGISQMGSMTEGPAVFKSPAKSLKMTGSPHHGSLERKGIVGRDLLLSRIDGVNKSVKKIEQLIEKNASPLGSQSYVAAPSSRIPVRNLESQFQESAS